jgi:hypothetical protein
MAQDPAAYSKGTFRQKPAGNSRSIPVNGRDEPHAGEGAHAGSPRGIAGLNRILGQARSDEIQPIYLPINKQPYLFGWGVMRRYGRGAL